MELLKDIIIDFCLFSLIEGWIYCLFFEKICRCKHFKWYQILILSFGNCIISQIFPPLIFQLFMALWMFLFLYVLNKNKRCFIYPLIFIIIMLMIEMNGCLLYELFFNIDFSIINKYQAFIINIPLKFLEIILINILNKKEVKIL